MKKIAMVLACFALVSMSMTAQVAKIALQHSGNVKLYDADQMSAVMTAAVDGDTIYLNEGSFTGDFTISKKVSIIGAGENTILTGAVTVNIPSTPTLTAHLLDALNIQSSITFASPTKGAKIRKCQFVRLDFNATTEDAMIDRCYSRGEGSYSFWLSNYVKNLNVINSKIYSLRGAASTSSDANFINCNIYCIYNWYSSDNCRATYMNCIIKNCCYNNSNYDVSTNYVNCLCGTNQYTFSVSQNCWNVSNSNLLNNNVECIYDDAYLQSNGYLGTDGTVVGITGGSTPFSLVPAVPKVTDYTIKVDPETKKLNVNLKVSAN